MNVHWNFVRVLGVAAGLVIGTATVDLRPAHAQAVQITAITPSCASAGDHVRITGSGFNLQSVAVAVGGVPAPLLALTANTVVFAVPASAQLGATTVTVTNPGGKPVSINFRVCDLRMPAQWGGTWRMIITYTDAVTNSITATDRYTTFIRTGEPVGVMAIANLANCTGSVSASGLQVQCTGHSSIGNCTASGAMQLSATLSSAGINGSGWSAISFSGVCSASGTNPPPVKRYIQIAGQQLSANQNPSGTPTTLFNNFVPLASLFAAGH